MCGPSAPKIVSQAVRVGEGMMTFGASEGYRRVPGPIGKTAAAPGDIAYVTAGGKGAPPSMPWDPKADAPPSPPDGSAPGSGGDAGPEPTPTGANPTDLAAMIAKKKLAALRMGLLSTMTNGGQGVSGAPSLFTPSAVAAGTTGTKTALGQ